MTTVVSPMTPGVGPMTPGVQITSSGGVRRLLRTDDFDGLPVFDNCPLEDFAGPVHDEA